MLAAQVRWCRDPTPWNGQPVVAFGAPQAGVSLHDPVTFGTLAQLAPSGQPVMPFEPPIDYPWPLQVGKTWSAHHTVTLYPSGNKVPLKVDG